MAGAALMGVCNVTPDSFSDGGDAFGDSAAKARVDLLLAEGAHIIDVGGESTRPGAAPVPAAEQVERTIPVVRYALSRGAIVSIDTADPQVAREAFLAGAHALNDVSCLLDSRLAEVVAEFSATYILMHARGPQEKMRGFSDYPDSGYGDVVSDVAQEWEAAAARALSLGVPRSALYFDPGLGFSKNAAQSMTLLAATRTFCDRLGVPVVVGASRKSFLRSVDAEAAPKERLGASIAAAVFAVEQGASILRVHDVRATRQAVQLNRALKRSAGEIEKGGAACSTA
ncbi:MAG: dihydropteroate synthase [Polyangiaceae bacterium]